MSGATSYETESLRNAVTIHVDFGFRVAGDTDKLGIAAKG